MNATPRKIIHLDMDCFYAAIEARDNPALRGKPIAVGGSPNGRGVVATCSYEAREYGIHSAMPMGKALRLCPNLLVLPVRIAYYRQVSSEIQAIFTEYTDLIEPLSLDEAFLDVSNCMYLHNSATLIAQEIRQRVWQAQHLTISAGVAPNKFLAKVASDWRKPNGLFVIRPEQVADFMPHLSVKKIPGVGSVTAAHLDGLGIRYCKELQTWSIERLSREFGKLGQRLYYLCRGHDDRAVSIRHLRKSLSVEDTYPHDLPNLSSCIAEIAPLFASLIARYARSQQNQKLTPKALFVKLRFHDFVTTTVQTAGNHPNIETYQTLIEQAWKRGQRPVRLLGLGMQFDDPRIPEQLSFPWHI